MEWRGRQDAWENMSYAWYEEDYEDYQGSYQDQDYSYQAQANQQELSYQEYEFQAWDSNYQPQEATSNQLSQEFNIKSMFESIMEGQVRGQREEEERIKEMQAQLDQATSTVKALENQMAQVASFSNPKENCKADSNQLSQDLDIKAMLQTYTESQEMGERKMEENFNKMQSQLDQLTSTIKVLESQLAEVESFSKVRDESKTNDILEGGMSEELRVEDPLEASIDVERGIEHWLLRKCANGFVTMLNESKEMVVEECLHKEVTELPKDGESTEEKLEGSAHEESWSELKALELELKQLPKGLRYAFLGPNSTHQVIVNDVCDHEVKWLLVELSEYRKTNSFSLNDIQSISHSLHLHYTHLEKESRTFIELQSRLNPNFPNAFTREEYFSLPFIDKTLERLGNHAFYCSLLGVLLPILCRLLWWLSLLLLALLVITKLKLFPG